MLSDKHSFASKAAKVEAQGITPPGYVPPQDEKPITIGGTDWWHILGLEPYGCPLRLWFEKRGVEPDVPQEVTKPMQRGLWLEDVAAKYFSKVTRIKVRRRKVKRRKGMPEWLGGHIDRHIVATESTDGPGILEIKTMGEWAYRRFQREGMTLGYVAQLQHYMLLTGWRWGMLAILEPSRWELYVGYAKADPELQKQMLSQAEMFVEQVEKGLRPTRVTNNPDHSACKACPYRRRCWGELLDAERSENGMEAEEDNSPQLVKAIEEYIAARDAKQEADALLEEAKRNLQELLGKREVVKTPVGIVEWRWSAPPKRFDVKAFKADHPELFEKYVREFEESRSRRLKVIL